MKAPEKIWLWFSERIGCAQKVVALETEDRSEFGWYTGYTKNDAVEQMLAEQREALLQISLPKIDEEILSYVEDTCLIQWDEKNQRWDWTQEAVDFGCAINYARARIEEY